MLIGETERLIIRSLSLADTPALAEILADPEVMKHSVRGVYDESTTRKFIAWCLSCYKSHGVGPWALIHKDSSALIGFCGVAPEPVGDNEEMNFGYRLARDYWGMGLATESARAALAFAFGIRALRSVVAVIEPDHSASVRVAEKVGFTGFEAIPFHGRQARLYRLTREQWLASHAEEEAASRIAPRTRG